MSDKSSSDSSSITDEESLLVCWSPLILNLSTLREKKYRQKYHQKTALFWQRSLFHKSVGLGTTNGVPVVVVVDQWKLQIKACVVVIPTKSLTLNLWQLLWNYITVPTIIPFLFAKLPKVMKIQDIYSMHKYSMSKSSSILLFCSIIWYPNFYATFYIFSACSTIKFFEWNNFFIIM